MRGKVGDGHKHVGPACEEVAFLCWVFPLFLCWKAEEDLGHILWHCDFATSVWEFFKTFGMIYVLFLFYFFYDKNDFY